MSRVVLLADGDALVRAVAALVLEDLGCAVVTPACGRQAIDTLLADARIEVLITEVNMPDMDGYTLARAATRTRKDPKVIILSGRESDGRGFPLVRKPFLLGDLLPAFVEGNLVDTRPCTEACGEPIWRAGSPVCHSRLA